MRVEKHRNKLRFTQILAKSRATQRSRTFRDVPRKGDDIHSQEGQPLTVIKC